ncbi:MAG: yesO1 [Glaciihabitans sp.]|nr:yesO1 [Glaciihabitans sp.]
MTTLRKISRHPLRVGAAVTAAAIALTGCSSGGGAGGDGDVNLTLTAWANAEEAEMYEAVLDVFEEENPGITVDFEYSDSGSYQDKLNTKFAAGSPADVMFLVGRWLGEYTSRGALLDLGDYPDDIDLDAMNQPLIKSQMTDDSVYAIPTGSTAIGLVVDTAVLDEYGIALPDDTTWTWDEFGDWARSITEASDGATKGSFFDPSWLPTFSNYVREQGEDVFDADGKLSVSESTVEDWFDLSMDLFDSEAFPPVESIDQTGAFSPEESPIGTGEVASAVIPANVFPTYDGVLEGKAALLRLPGDSSGERLSIAVTPTLVWSAAATSKHPAEAAKLIDFLTNNPDSFTDRGTFLGVPINSDVAEGLSADLEPAEATFVDYVAKLQGEDRDPYYLEPAGAGEAAQALTSIVTEVEFGRMTPAEGAAKFMTDAQAALEQAG